MIDVINFKLCLINFVYFSFETPGGVNIAPILILGSDKLKPSKLDITNYFWRSLTKVSISGKYLVEIEIKIQTVPVESKKNLSPVYDFLKPLSLLALHGVLKFTTLNMKLKK